VVKPGQRVSSIQQKPSVGRIRRFSTGSQWEYPKSVSFTSYPHMFAFSSRPVHSLLVGLFKDDDAGLSTVLTFTLKSPGTPHCEHFEGRSSSEQQGTFANSVLTVRKHVPTPSHTHIYIYTHTHPPPVNKVYKNNAAYPVNNR